MRFERRQAKKSEPAQRCIPYYAADRSHTPAAQEALSVETRALFAPARENNLRTKLSVPQYLAGRRARTYWCQRVATQMRDEESMWVGTECLRPSWAYEFGGIVAKKTLRPTHVQSVWKDIETLLRFEGLLLSTIVVLQIQGSLGLPLTKGSRSTPSNISSVE